MATVGQKHLSLDDTIMFVLVVLEERVDIPLDVLKAISAQVSGMTDREAKRARILALADEYEGNAQARPASSEDP